MTSRGVFLSSERINSDKVSEVGLLFRAAETLTGSLFRISIPSNESSPQSTALERNQRPTSTRSLFLGEGQSGEEVISRVPSGAFVLE